MEQLLKVLNFNPKVAMVSTSLEPSLDDSLIYSRFQIIIQTKRNLIPLLKSIYVSPSNKSGLFRIRFYLNRDPNTTLLKEIYQKYKTADWQQSKTSSDNPTVYLECDSQILFKIINYYYSTIN